MPGRFVLDLVAIPSPALVARSYFIAAQNLDKLAEPLERASRVISQEIDMNFQSEGRPGPWAALAQKTVSRKSSQGLDPRILQATGALYAGATSPGSWDISTGGSEGTAVLGDPTGYGDFHINGTRFMPIRDWSFVSDDALGRIDEVFAEWFEEVLESAGV